MTKAMGCDEARISLGTYVLGAIEPGERAVVDTHLAGCAKCRAELADLDGLPAVLDLVSAEDAARLPGQNADVPPALSAVIGCDADRPVRAPVSLSASRNGRGRLRIAVASAAAAGLAVLAGLSGALLGSHGAQSGLVLNPGSALGPWQTTGVDGAAGTRAIVRYRTMSWGTEIAVKTMGIPSHTACSVEAIGPAGQSASAGSWTTDASEGKVWYTAGTGLSGERLSRFVITIEGRPPITIPA